MEKSLRFLITRESGNILRESIRLPEGFSQIIFDINYPKEFTYNSYLMVFDGQNKLRMQKLLGYGEQTIGIGEKTEDTTIGGIPGEICAGEWTICIGIFTEYLERYQGKLPVTLSIIITNEYKKITEPLGKRIWTKSDKDFSIAYENFEWSEMYQSEEKWYKGDFHTHTRLSDGKETVKNAVKKALRDGMDFYMPTEHNLLHTGWEDTKLMVIPSVEVTTDLGHFNLFGLTRFPSHILDIMKYMGTEQMEEHVLKQIEEAKKENWIVSLNHPFLHIWKWQCQNVLLCDVNCIEIVNDPTYEYAEEANQKAIQFVDFLWMDGHRIYGLGGSDSHNLEDERYPGATMPSIPGDPATFVHACKLTPEILLSNVRKGHALVTRFCRAEIRIQGTESDYLPGDEILEDMVVLHLDIWDCDKSIKVYLVSYDAQDDGIKRKLIYNDTFDWKEELPISTKRSLKTQIVFSGEQWQWRRIEIVTEDDTFLMYMNPVYRGRKENKYSSYGDAITAMEASNDN